MNQIAADNYKKTVFDVLSEKAAQIGFGEWQVKLIIYNGEVTGFDQMDSPLIKFRVTQKKNE